MEAKIRKRNPDRWYGESGTWFWIDALCINQSSVTERNHQVQQMWRIYENRRVCAWLGSDERFADILALRMETMTDAWRLRESSYWERAWIVQEVALARHMTLMAGC